MAADINEQAGDDLSHMVVRMHVETLRMSEEQRKFYAAGIEDAISVFTASAMVVNRDCGHLSAHHRAVYTSFCKMVSSTADFVRVIITGGKN